MSAKLRRKSGGKLRSPRGEMLVETLVAVLIVTLASIVFLTVTLTAVRLGRAAKDRNAEIYSALTAAETYGTIAAAGCAVEVDADGNGMADYTIPVDVYGSSGGLMAYKAG